MNIRLIAMLIGLFQTTYATCAEIKIIHREAYKGDTTISFGRGGWITSMEVYLKGASVGCTIEDATLTYKSMWGTSHRFDHWRPLADGQRALIYDTEQRLLRNTRVTVSVACKRSSASGDVQVHVVPYIENRSRSPSMREESATINGFINNTASIRINDWQPIELSPGECRGQVLPVNGDTDKIQLSIDQINKDPLHRNLDATPTSNGLEVRVCAGDRAGFGVSSIVVKGTIL
ncbi:hypothetical protein [Pantoea sp. AMG 501]|uniref:hypothetical protein n=1 Tax=Pantoea sp. AMG 501 TaxID=2008894 RepID=UPI000B5A96CF|nr:hypothetical protein [Pantoea sp. AMG 501]OWY74465.1 hypothetical protein CDN97_23430 [Pantoea sp. AMG 501]